jgi:hypothetical protein
VLLSHDELVLLSHDELVPLSHDELVPLSHDELVPLSHDELVPLSHDGLVHDGLVHGALAHDALAPLSPVDDGSALLLLADVLVLLLLGAPYVIDSALLSLVQQARKFPYPVRYNPDSPNEHLSVSNLQKKCHTVLRFSIEYRLFGPYECAFFSSFRLRII